MTYPTIAFEPSPGEIEQHMVVCYTRMHTPTRTRPMATERMKDGER